MRSLRTALAATILAVTASAAAQEGAPATADCTFQNGVTTCVTEVHPSGDLRLDIVRGDTFCTDRNTGRRLLADAATLTTSEGQYYYRVTTVYRGRSEVVASETSVLVIVSVTVTYTAHEGSPLESFAPCW